MKLKIGLFLAVATLVTVLSVGLCNAGAYETQLVVNGVGSLQESITQQYTTQAVNEGAYGSKIQYESNVQAFNGAITYESTFGFGEGLQTGTKDITFAGNPEMPLNAATIMDKAGIASVGVGGDDTGIQTFAAQGFNWHGGNAGEATVSISAAAAGAGVKATNIGTWSSELMINLGAPGTPSPADGGTLTLHTAGDAISGTVSGSMIGFDYAGTKADGVGGVDTQTFEHSFSFSGPSVSFDFQAKAGIKMPTMPSMP